MAEGDGTLGGQPMENGADNGPQIGLLAQYIKDLSFENPNAPAIYQNQQAPQMDVQFNISANPVGDDVHEVALKIEAKATFGDTVGFQVELVYAGLFGIRGVTEEMKAGFLFAEAPRLLFPFARRVVADATRDGNFPPLILDPIDFVQIYNQRVEQMGQLAEGETAGQA